MSIYFGTRKFAGQGDFFAAASAGGFVTIVIGTLFTLVSGMINVWTITLTIVIAIVSVLLLLPRRDRD